MTASPSTPRLGHQQLAQLWGALSERDLAVIKSVGECQFLTTRQIERLYFPATGHTPLGAARCARRVLHRLTEMRALVRLDRRIGGVRAGSASFAYALGPVGARLLRRDAPRPRFREPSTTFLHHRLAVAEVLVRVVEASRADALDLIDFETEPKNWRRYSEGYESAVLKPDLRLTIGVGRYESHWFLEIDRGTEHLPALLRKCRQYARHHATGAEQASAGVAPRVAWLMDRAHRVEMLATAIARDSSLSRGLFEVRHVDDAMELLAEAEASS